ncbi:MAG: alpha/beta hydrolase [Myxococcales bacterium]
MRGSGILAGLTVALAATASAQTAVVHEEGFFAGAGGLRLYQQAWRPSGTPRAVVVIVHGLKDYSGHYAAFARELVAHGFAVHGLDLRGHGKSPGDRVWVDSFNDYLDDLDAFLKVVRQREPGRPIFLFGHSMGGGIAALYTITRQPELAGLVLSGPALKPGADVSRLLIGVTKLLAAVAPHLRVMDLPDENFSRDPAIVAAMKTDPLIDNRAGPARTAAELLRAFDRIEAHEEAVRVPLLDMHGTRDKLTNPEGSRELVARAASKDKTLKLYSGLYHDLLHEPEKAQVTADVVAWLDARAPPAAK